MTEIQKELLQLLKEIDDICNKYGIEYYLGGGSLIGAIRHGGFLPWDDDADIHMSRENADKFVDAVAKENLPDRIVYTGEGDSTYGNAHWRYQNTKSTVLLRSLVGSTSQQGQFVDIFINYPLPQDEKLAEQCLLDYEIYSELKAQNFTISSIINRTDDFFAYYKKAKIWEKIIGKRRVLMHLEKRMFHFPETEDGDWFLRAPYPPKRVTKKEWWGTPRREKFESLMLPVAEYAEKLLCYEYSPTWYEVPPHVDRGEHVFVTDTEIPYNKYTEEYDKYLDTKDFYNYEVKKKDYWFSLLKDRNKVNPHIWQLHGKKIVMEIQQTIEKNHLDLQNMVNMGMKEELACVFSSYFQFIQKHSIKYYSLYIDMPDLYLYSALYFSCFDGNYGLARKILGMRREKEEREMPDYLNELCEVCDATDALLTELYGEKNYVAAEEVADIWLEKYPNLLYFMRAKIYLELRKEKKNEAILLKKCEAYLKLYPDDGELLKYRGDILLRMGQKAEAENCYLMALNTLHNGYCITDIKNYFGTKEAV